MSTILESSLHLIGASIAGGLPWDLIKYGSVKIVESFQRRFAGSYGMKESECQGLLELLASQRCLDCAKPLKEAAKAYESCTGKLCPDRFLNDYAGWLEDNRAEFERLGRTEVRQAASITVNGNLRADRGGSIQLIGNQYNAHPGRQP